MSFSRNSRTLTALGRAGLAMLLLGLVAASPAAAESWKVDRAHSHVGFSVRHFFTPVAGSFHDFEITLDFDAANPEASSVGATIQIGSIDTANEKRDGHLESADFFEAEAHPVMTFKSTGVRKTGDARMTVSGELTIKGVTRPAELEVELLGVQELPEEMQQRMGGLKKVASFRATTTLDRGDFGVGVGNWAATAVVGSDVEIEILIEAQQR